VSVCVLVCVCLYARVSDCACVLRACECVCAQSVCKKEEDKTEEH